MNLSHTVVAIALYLSHFGRLFQILLVVALAFGVVKPAVADDTQSRHVESWINSQINSIKDLYLHLHRNPELSLQEEATSARIAEELRAAGCEVTTGVGGHGVVGLMNNGEGPCVMLRCDLDALPITEKTGLEYASQVIGAVGRTRTGVMHACGHDIHMANLVGVARYFGTHREQWRGTLMFVGQPAEEGGRGALMMLEDGLFHRFPRPDVAMALHVSADMPTGKVGYCPGPAMADVHSVDITLHGKGGHGSAPDTTIDPVVQAAELVMSLQTIVSREISPHNPAVITVGSIHGGTQHNVIGSECHLQLTVRSYSDQVRDHLLEAIQRKARAVAQGARAPAPTIKIRENEPYLHNDEQLAERMANVFRQTLGDDNVIKLSPAMTGEDFSRYGRTGIPILMYRLGAVSPSRLERFAATEQQPPSLHSPQFYPDYNETLKTGILTMTMAVMNLMEPQSK